MARKNSVLAALFAAAACILLLFTDGSLAGMAERARQERGKRASLAAASHNRRQQPGKQAFRYLNNKTEPFQIKSLPDINLDLGEIYSGQIPVDKNDPSRKMFFVYQPTIGKPVDEVVIWFNGGPGCSSLEGFLQENGLFIWGWGQSSATINQYSWVNETNVLWVEYPIGLGFSTGNVTATSEEETAADFLGFFKNFEETFGIKNYKIYVTGESYAGRYVPYVSAAMLDKKDKEYYDLSGAILYDPVIGQYEYVGQSVPLVPYVKKYAEFFNYNETFLQYLDTAYEQCGYKEYYEKYMAFPPAGVQPQLIGGTPQNSKASVDCDVWSAAYIAASQPNPCFNVYEISSMCPVLSDPLGFPGDLIYQYPGMGGIYFDRKDVKEAMHAPQDVTWAECSGPVFADRSGPYKNGDNSLDPIQKVLPQIIEATGRVLVSNGNYDMEIITAGTLLSIQNMTWGGQMGFQQEPCEPIDIKLPDLQWAQAFADSGQIGFDGPGQGIMGIQHFERGLMWAETFQSGHMQPQFQPRSSYLHLQWMLGRIDHL
jgi:carboxypeptidase D